MLLLERLRNAVQPPGSRSFGQDCSSPSARKTAHGLTARCRLRAPAAHYLGIVRSQVFALSTTIRPPPAATAAADSALFVLLVLLPPLLLPQLRLLQVSFLLFCLHLSSERSHLSSERSHRPASPP